MLNTDGAMPAMKLELVPMPVSDVDRAKAFYEKAGFKLEVDTRPTDTMRVVQFTPPGSACTIVFRNRYGADHRDAARIAQGSASRRGGHT